MRFTKSILLAALIAILVPLIHAQEPFETFVEYTEGGNIIRLPKIQFRYDVDINSYIDIRFHPNAIAFDDSDILSSPQTDKLRREIKDLNNLLRQARDELHKYVRNIESLRNQLLKGAGPAVEREFRKKLREHGALSGEIIKVLRPVYEDRMIEAFDALGQNYAELVSLLAEHIKNIQQKLYDETASLIQNNELTLNVWCIHSSEGKEPTAIHLNNYDDLKAGSFHVIDKLTLSRTEEEDRHLKESVVFHEDMREFVRDISSSDSKILQVFKELRTQFLSDLQDFKSLFDTQELQNPLDEIKEKINQLTVSEEPKALNEKLEEIEKKLGKFFNLRKDHASMEKYKIFSDYLNAIKGIADRMIFIETISDKVGDPGDLMPEKIREVAFSEAPPTVIDIPRTNRNENDSYNLYVQIYRKGYPTLLKEYSFRIKKYGTYRKWTGNLIFVKGEWQKSFQPATSVSWILHHRSRPKETNGKIKGGGGILGNVLNLGIGLNSVVFSTGSEIEYGLGITFTLLNDILQIGYGINFQREDHRGYFFIGASLFDLLNRTR